MAKKKEVKNYAIKVADGKFTFQMTKTSADGKYHSLQVPYPFRDGKVRLTRKQTENYCLNYAREKGWLELAADGK